VYGIEEIRRGIRRPREALMEVNAVYNRWKHGADYNPDGVDVFAEDWDALVILDSFRYDVFAERSTLPGRLESRTSRGGGTVEFLFGNFADRDLRDTVYVTANPQFYHFRDDLATDFHAVWNVWQDRWDDDLRTVPPDVMTEACLETAAEYPDKRLLCHYNQPHPPFIGPSARELGFEPEARDRGFVSTFLNNIFHEFVSREGYREAYAENADLALDAAATLLDELRGRVVVTADHGEMLGERAAPLPVRYYSHRIGVHVDELTRVPWLVREGDDRPTIRSGDAERMDESATEETVAARLRDLGYVE
jgi:hypothetical protein